MGVRGTLVWVMIRMLLFRVSETPKSFLGCANWVRSGSLSTSSVAPRRQGLREKGALIIIIYIILGAPYYTYSIMGSKTLF